MKESVRKELKRAIAKFSAGYPEDRKKAILDFLRTGGYMAEQEERRLCVAVHNAETAYAMGKNPAWLKSAETMREELDELRTLVADAIEGEGVDVEAETVAKMLEKLLTRAKER